MKIFYCGKRALRLAFVLLIIMLPLYAQDVFLAGSSEGLFRIDNFRVKKIWRDAAVLKISKAGNQWLFLTGKGLAASKNLKDFYYLNDKLPKKIIKNIDKNGNKTFIEKIPQLKDLEVHPFNPNIFVTATSSNVFLTRDSGKTWEDLGANHSVNGIKAVSVLDMPNASGEKVLTVFVSHSIAGMAWKQPDVNSKIWNNISDGLKKGPEGVEEVSDIVFNQISNESQVYCAQTFSGLMYRLDWNKKIFILLNEKEANDKKLVCVDSLNIIDNTVFGVMEGGLFETNLIIPNTQIYTSKKLLKNYDKVKKYLKNSNYLCAFVPSNLTSFNGNLSLSELWLLHDKKNQSNPYLKISDGKKGIYTPTHQMREDKSFEKHLKTIKDNKLNALVIDMKDEAGFVRYESKNENIKKYNGVKYTLDIEKLIKKAKAENIYLIARIVVFKDKNLYRYNEGQYAVKDKETGKPWQGYNIYNGEKEIIQEHWVDPYNEDVWKYNVDIAEELCSLGFDEIQFDYIRFPTDGLNLANVRYPAQENGMDKVSALMSFLAYSRERIKAPLSIDIYGANGWYRTGARTGQEVELLAEYVDVICPMFYPSHFSQSFLAYKPAEERPYRIYHQGSYRNKLMARNKVIVRPWAQAFFIPVSYDKKYYDENYVKRQILGIKDSIDEGYIYWNNSGRYLDLRPDGGGLIMTEFTAASKEFHAVHQWGIEVIRTVQNFSNPVITEILKVFTDASTYGFVVFIIGLYLWCIDYKKGLHLAYAAAFTSGLNGGIKRILKVPRPFTHAPEIMLKSIGGYSTPSGHSSISALIYPAALFYKPFQKEPSKDSQSNNIETKGTASARLKIAAAISLPLLVGFSRVYLGVHYPTDVLLGWALGAFIFLALMFLLPAVEARLSSSNKTDEEDPQNIKFKKDASIRFTLAAIFSFILILISKEKVNEAGVILGLAFGNIRILENSKYNFDASSGSALQKLLRFIIGATLSCIPILIFYLLKIDSSYAQYRLYRFLEFFAVGAVASGLAPIIFCRLKLSGGENADR